MRNLATVLASIVLCVLIACSSAERKIVEDGASTGVAGTTGGSAWSAAGTANSEPSAGGAMSNGGSTSGSAGASGSAVVAVGGAVQPMTGGAPSHAGSAGSADGLVTGGSSGAAGLDGLAGSGGSNEGTPGLRVVGRTASGDNGAVRFSWPGVSIRARFSGTQASLDLDDGTNKNRFTVVVDQGAPKTVTTVSGQSSLALATGLEAGSHEVWIWRNTEASAGVTQIKGLSGLSSGGSLLTPSAAPARRIEVIGDSLSVGAGVEGTSTTCSPGIDAFTNNYLAYGSVAARNVNADVVTIAWSGIGVYRSYGGSAPTMPARYDYAVPNDNSAWNFAKYQPQVVVINLGTNDFSDGNPGQPYIDAYVSFVKHVRSKYASASFILIDMYGGERLTAINSVVGSLKSGGEMKVEVLSFNTIANLNTACNQHPNTAAQQAMGNVLADRLKSLMGW